MVNRCEQGLHSHWRPASLGSSGGGSRHGGRHGGRQEVFDEGHRMMSPYKHTYVPMYGQGSVRAASGTTLGVLGTSKMKENKRFYGLQLQLQLLLEDSIPPTLTTFEMVASLHHLLPLLHVFSSTHHMSGVVPSLHHVRAPQPMVLRRVSVCRCACSACSSAKEEGEAGGLSAQRAYRVSCVCRVSSCLCHRVPF